MSDRRGCRLIRPSPLPAAWGAPLIRSLSKC
jgi:hypothetical protein